MDKQDIYKYFTLKSQLHTSVKNWIKEKVKDTYYKHCPIYINSINNLGGGQIEVKVDFQVPPCNDFIEEIYGINVEELQDY